MHSHRGRGVRETYSKTDRIGGNRRLNGAGAVAATVAGLLIFAAAPASAALVVIETGAESFTAANGDEMGTFFAVAGATDDSAPGQVVEVLGGNLGGSASLQASPNESGSNSLNIGTLWSILDDEGVTSTSSLVFGFGVNEPASASAGWVTITDLVMTFELPDSSVQTFDLLGDTIEVNSFNSGTNSAEARIQVDFGAFDFMAQYNAASTEQFTISATIADTAGGFEIFFLSGGYTAAPPAPPSVPEPAAATGLMLLLLTLRRTRSA